MPRTSGKPRRARGHIRRRGGSSQVLVYAGIDPLTGKDHYLTESTSDEAQAQKVLTRLLSQVDERRNPRTKATLGAALESWLRTHEAEETTLDGLPRLRAAHDRTRAWRRVARQDHAAGAGGVLRRPAPLSASLPRG